MRIKAAFVFTLLLGLGIMFYGLNEKKTYTDFSELDEPMNQFCVGILPEGMVERQVSFLPEELPNSAYILEVKCLNPFDFRCSCVTQAVEIEKVIKGEDTSVGEQINIVRANSTIYLEEDMKILDRPSINMGFVNEMIPGESYLVFLEEKVDSPYKNDDIYVTCEFIIAPIFSLNDLPSYACHVDSGEGVSSSYYETVSGSQYFFKNEQDIEIWEKFRREILKEYLG